MSSVSSASSAIVLSLLAALLSGPSLAADPFDEVFDLENLTVKITEDLPFAEVTHDGEPVKIMRHQDPDHRIDAPYDKTSRECPPFCVQPMRLAPGVETIGELELVQYLKRVSQGDQTILVIDSRTNHEFERGTIPGAINVPYKKLDRSHATADEIADTMEMDFGAIRDEDLWNFSAPKTLVFFCNGPWCGQSPTNIKALLTAGYPPTKLKWYRGGLQSWEQFGLTTVGAVGAGDPGGDEDAAEQHVRPGPLLLLQSKQSPVSPESDASVGEDVEDDPCEGQYQK